MGMLPGTVLDDLPDPLRQALLSWPLIPFSFLLTLLFLLALVQRIAPLDSLPLRSPSLSALSLLAALAPLPWIDSLLWLPLLWCAVTWAGVLCLPPPPERSRSAITPLARSWLRQGLWADGLLGLACALFFWAQGGTWSRAGVGFVADVPPSQRAPASLDPPPQLPRPSLTLSPQAIATGLSPDRPPSLRTALHNKVFLGLPLDWVVLCLFLAAVALKAGIGLRLGRRLLPTLFFAASPASQHVQYGLPALASPLLALHLWLRLRVLW